MSVIASGEGDLTFNEASVRWAPRGEPEGLYAAGTLCAGWTRPPWPQVRPPLRRRLTIGAVDAGRRRDGV